jgi:hypothetical protein
MRRGSDSCKPNMKRVNGTPVGIKHAHSRQGTVLREAWAKPTPRPNTMYYIVGEPGCHCGNLIPEFGDAFRL